MSTIPNSARELGDNSVSAGVTIPTTAQGRPLVKPPRVLTKILLRGGHSTTIHGREPSELNDEIAEAKGHDLGGGFWFVHHHEGDGVEPNGVAIDPHSVVGLISIPPSPLG